MASESTPMLRSAVRLPTPEPIPQTSNNASTKRKRPSFSRSPSPQRGRPRTRSPQPQHRQNALRDVDPNRAAERERQLAQRLRKQETMQADVALTESEKQSKAKEEYQRLLTARSGGTYVPPAKLRALQAQVTDKRSKEYQRMAWDALKKSINGLINKVNVSNIKFIVPELFTENLVRGRGLFVQSVMKAQAASLPFTPVYATMAAIVNTKLPQVGELLMNRLVVRFRKAFKRNDKTACLSSTTFIAHLCNQQVVHELLAAQMLQLLLSKPTDDSVEIAVALMREVGRHLEEMNGPIAMLVFDQFRNILHEAQELSKKSQYAIEVLFQVRRDKYKENPAIRDELDLIEETDQITHSCSLDDQLETQETLNVFKFDSDYEENEEAYGKLKAEILGESDGDDTDSGSDSASDDQEEQQIEEAEVKDLTNAQLTQLRKTIYLTISSSSTFEECAHKLMRLTIPVGQEMELPMMLLETCVQRPTYENFYGLIAERFAQVNRLWQNLFEELFVKTFQEIHRRETNPLRSAARFFGYLLGGDGAGGAIGWHVLSTIQLNEEETTSSSRIFIKILFQDLVEQLGVLKMKQKIEDPALNIHLRGLFPIENPRHIRFSINYFTSIGLGMLTEQMRESLQHNKPGPALLATSDNNGTKGESESISSYSTTASRSSSSTRSISSSRNSASRSNSPVNRRTRTQQRSSRSSSRSPNSRKPYDQSRSPTRNHSSERSPATRRADRSHTGSRRQEPSSGRFRRQSDNFSPPHRSSRHERRSNSISSSSPSRSSSPPQRSRRGPKKPEYRRDTSSGSDHNNANNFKFRKEQPKLKRKDRDHSSGEESRNSTTISRRSLHMDRKSKRNEVRDLSPYSRRAQITSARDDPNNDALSPQTQRARASDYI